MSLSDRPLDEDLPAEAAMSSADAKLSMSPSAFAGFLPETMRPELCLQVIVDGKTYLDLNFEAKFAKVTCRPFPIPVESLPLSLKDFRQGCQIGPFANRGKQKAFITRIVRQFHNLSIIRFSCLDPQVMAFNLAKAQAEREREAKEFKTRHGVKDEYVFKPHKTHRIKGRTDRSPKGDVICYQGYPGGAVGPDNYQHDRAFAWEFSFKQIDTTPILSQLHKAIVHVSADINQHADAKGGGSTCVLGLQVGNRMITANIGDSYVVLLRLNSLGLYEATLLNWLHNVDEPSEAALITKQGGKIRNGYVWDPSLRKGIAMSRSIGDQYGIVGHCSDPDFTEVETQAGDIILALSDATCQVMTRAYLAVLLNFWLDLGGDLADFPQCVCEVIIRLGSLDNASCVMHEVKAPADSKRAKFFGVLDGHRKENVADMLLEKVPQKFMQYLNEQHLLADDKKESLEVGAAAAPAGRLLPSDAKEIKLTKEFPIFYNEQIDCFLREVKKLNQPSDEKMYLPVVTKIIQYLATHKTLIIKELLFETMLNKMSNPTLKVSEISKRNTVKVIMNFAYVSDNGDSGSLKGYLSHKDSVYGEQTNAAKQEILQALGKWSETLDVPIAASQAAAGVSSSLASK